MTRHTDMTDEEEDAPQEEEESLASVLRAWQEAIRAGTTGITTAPAAGTPDSITVDDVYADLVGTWEIAEALGVPKRRVERWIERRPSTGCPRPVKTLKMGHLYRLADWQGWFALWRVTRAPDRPMGLG